MNINFYDLYNTVFKSGIKIVDDNDNYYFNFNDIITPNHCFGTKPRETVLRLRKRDVE